MQRKDYKTPYNTNPEIEEEFGSKLVWDRLDGKKASLFCTYIKGLDFKKQDNYPELMQQIIDYVVSLRDVLKKHL